MSITGRVIWQIESRMSQTVTLTSLSELCSISQYHLSRTFRSATGMSPMAYLRSRRLSNAAKSLAYGDDEILTIALHAQYGSHEAFTRAFLSYFGILPSTVRQARSIQNLKLQESIEMDTSRLVAVGAPELRDRTAFEVIGLGVQCAIENTSEIPSLWQTFNERVVEVTAVSDAAAYGVCLAAGDDGRFRYVAGVESEKGATAPKGMEKVSITAGRYAVFTHVGHISTIGNTVYTIWNKSLSDLGLHPQLAPDFERYDNRFDPKTGRGSVEIWIPVTA